MFRKNITSFLQENGKLFNCHNFYVNIFTAWPKSDSAMFKEPVLMNKDNILKLFGNLDVVHISCYGKLDNDGCYHNTTIYFELVY